MRNSSVRVLALALILALAGAACGKEPSAVGSGAGNAQEPSLRVETAGGFIPRDYALRNFPEFSLTAGGHVVAGGAQIEIFPPPAFPAMVSRTITATAVERIVAEAEAAGLGGPDKTYKNDTVADAATTTFVYRDSKGVTHTISAYALGIGEGPDGPAPRPAGQSAEDAEARDKLAKLREKLLDLPSWIDDKELGEEASYRFESLRIYVQPYVPNPGTPQSKKAWPLSSSLATFGAPYEGPGTRCGVAEGADLETLRKPLSESNTQTPWESQGKSYTLILRPLIPGESGCPAS